MVKQVLYGCVLIVTALRDRYPNAIHWEAHRYEHTLHINLCGTLAARFGRTLPISSPHEFPFGNVVGYFRAIDAKAPQPPPHESTYMYP